MGTKVPGYGLGGKQGAAGPAGPQGAPGSKGDQGTAGAQGPQGVKGDVGATGPKGDAGTSATLGTANPQALGTAAPGTSTNAAREDHVHPRPSGLQTLVGNVVVTETLLLSLSVGAKRMTLPLAGVALTDKLIAVPNGVPTTGCEVLNAYPGAAAGTVSVGYYTPLLGIGATYTIPVSVYRIV